MNAVILERKEERLIPLTLNCPKLMLNIMDRPLVCHISDYLSENGISTYTLLENGWINSFPEDMENKISEFTDRNSILSILHNAKEDILFITRPMITDMSLKKALNYHIKTGGGITAIYNKGRETGIYIISKGALNDGCREKKYNLSGYFSFVETPEEYISLHRDILKGKLSVKTESSVKNKGVIMGENTMLKIGALIKPPVFIGKGTVIESGAKIDAYTVIGSDCVVSQGAHIAGSVVNKGCFIGKNAVLKKSLVAPSAKIKNKAVLSDMCAVGEASVIGEAATLSKGVNVWNGKYIPDGEEITKNVTTGGKIPSVSFESNTVTGKAGADFVPEDAALLGALYSRLYPELKIAVASDSAPASVMIKYAFVSGAMSAGGDVTDAGSVVKSVLKYAIEHFRFAGGVYISENNGEVTLELFSKDAFEIRKKDFKRLKEMYPESKFIRAEPKNIKPVLLKENIAGLYYDKMCSEFKGGTGEKYVYLSTGEAEREYAEKLSSASGVKLISHRKNGYIAGEISRDTLNIYNENGSLVSEEDYIRLCMAAAKEGEEKFILKRDYSPKLISFADRIGLKTSVSAEEELLKEIKTAGAQTQYLMSSDKVYAFFRICDYLNRKKTLLKDLLVFFKEM